MNEKDDSEETLVSPNAVAEGNDLGHSRENRKRKEMDSDDEENDDEEDEFLMDDLEDEDDNDDEPKEKKSKPASDGNSGWADAMAKILATNKPILSKAKKDKDIVMKKKSTKSDDLEIADAQGNMKTPVEDVDNRKAESVDDVADRKRSTKREKKGDETFGRIKPHILERNFERSLQRVATRGVIQLFNAVNKHQKDVKEKLKKEGKSEFKRDAVLKTVTKGDFIDMLKGKGKGGATKEAEKLSVAKEPTRLPVSESTWKILKDDFMMTKGKSMKDWDKESDSGEE